MDVELTSLCEQALLDLRTEVEHLFYVAALGREAIFRPLSMAEHRAMAMAGDSLNPWDLNDWIVKKCTLFYTKGLDFLLDRELAGIVDVIAQSILTVSGTLDEEGFIVGLQQARERASSLEAMVQTYICAAFKNMSPNDIKKLSFREQMDYLAKSEAILGKPIELNKLFGRGAKKRGRSAPPIPAGYSSLEAMLNKESADIPDFKADNEQLSKT